MAAPGGGAWRSKTASAARATGAPAAAGPPAVAKRPEGSSRATAKPPQDALLGCDSQHVDERLLFAASVLIGHTVHVQVSADERLASTCFLGQPRSPHRALCIAC